MWTQRTPNCCLGARCLLRAMAAFPRLGAFRGESSCGRKLLHHRALRPHTTLQSTPVASNSRRAALQSAWLSRACALGAPLCARVQRSGRSRGGAGTPCASLGACPSGRRPPPSPPNRKCSDTKPRRNAAKLGLLAAAAAASCNTAPRMARPAICSHGRPSATEARARGELPVSESACWTVGARPELVATAPAAAKRTDPTTAATAAKHATEASLMHKHATGMSSPARLPSCARLTSSKSVQPGSALAEAATVRLLHAPGAPTPAGAVSCNGRPETDGCSPGQGPEGSSSSSPPRRRRRVVRLTSTPPPARASSQGRAARPKAAAAAGPDACPPSKAMRSHTPDSASSSSASSRWNATRPRSARAGRPPAAATAAAIASKCETGAGRRRAPARAERVCPGPVSPRQELHPHPASAATNSASAPPRRPRRRPLPRRGHVSAPRPTLCDRRHSVRGSFRAVPGDFAVSPWPVRCERL